MRIVFLAFFAMSLGCEPYEHPPEACEGAQERLDAAAEECDTSGPDLYCRNQEYEGDYSDYWRHLSESTSCAEGELRYEIGGACVMYP